MPATIAKIEGGYRVRTPRSVHAKKTTLLKARKQVRLLNAIDHGFKPTKNLVSRPGRIRKGI